MTSNGVMVHLGSEDLTDDDAWGSDFDESCEELYSQEIEDNKINENLEAQQQNASKTKPKIRGAYTDNLDTITTPTTEGAYGNVSPASTGAIPKRGFSYLFNASFIQQGSLVNHAGFQKTVKPEPKDKNIEMLNETSSRTTKTPATTHFVSKNLIPESNLENHAVFQRHVKPEPKDKNIDARNETRIKTTVNPSTSHFVNRNLIQESNLENHRDFQKAVKTQTRDTINQKLNETNSTAAVIPTVVSAGSLNDVKIKNEPNLNTAPETKNQPGKLRPEAFNFLNRLPAKMSNNGKDITNERKHLVPTAFIHADNLHRSQSKIENQMSHDTETDYPVPSAPPNFDPENYESVSDDSNKKGSEPFENHQEDRASSPARNYNETAKPALPSRPPPIFKNFSPSFTTLSASTRLDSKLSISSISVKDDLSSKEKSTPVDVRPETKKTRTEVKSFRSTISANLVSRPLPSPPVSDQINSTLQLKSASTSPLALELASRPLPPVPDLNSTLPLKYVPSSPLTPELKSRPLPSLPVSHQTNSTLQSKSTHTSPLTPELISRPLPTTTTFHQSNLTASVLDTVVDQISASDENSNININTPPINSPLYPVDAILETKNPTSTPRDLGNEQILKETLRPSAQKRLTQIIGTQSQVSSAVFNSQQKISSAIASRLSGLQKDVTDASALSLTNSMQNISHITDEEEYLQSITRSPSIETQKPKIPPRKISSSQGKESVLNQSSSSNSENTNPSPFTDIDALHSSISRPSLPQKLKTTQRSVSCSSLVQSFKDLSFAMWIPPPKEKRISAGSSCFDASPKEFTKENTDKLTKTRGFSVPSGDMPKEVSAPKPMKSIPDFSERSVPTRHAWYHDVDAREAQRRLLNFIDQNGAFLIRPSTRKTVEIQHTACIVFSGRIINMHIRQKQNGQFALGTEKEGEQTFPSIYDLIKYHQEVPIESSRHQSSLKSFSACLRVTPPKP